ncbi:phosphoglucosamine mutase [Bacilli bacterium PM5-3]|nr:phosphoglucosamine mutase [Bacilli bacterium PM5-3]MDH6603718.1 phosphoglucosamine mutase [Bacilli bacterium PM5-9]
MGKYFGTDGIRGVANEELSATIAFKVGQYLGYTFKGENILIGMDTRMSKDMLEAALCAGITSAGANVYTSKVISTPGVSYLVRENNFSAGIMISASHNPYYDNGIKVFNNSGEKIAEELENNIEKYIDDEISIELANKDEIGVIINYEHQTQKYLDFLASTVDLDLSKFKVIIDCANGSASALASKLFSKLNIQHEIIFNKPNGININVDCGSTHLNNLINKVKESDVDLGIAFDGDADRMLAVDQNGNIIDGDLILYICSKYLKAQNKLNNDTLVTTVMSNIGLYKALDKEGIKYEKTAVGDKYVYENMVTYNNSLGGEQSGHIIFKEYATTGDGMLSAIQLLEAIAYSNKSLLELASEVTIYPQLLVNVKVNDKKKVLESDLLKEEVENVEKELHGDGRVLLRASGTEPLIRVMVEASTEELCKKHVDYLVKIVESIS